MTKIEIRELRRFGIVVGAIFLAIGAWWIYREKFDVVARIFAGGGAFLIVAGAIMPRILRLPYRFWMFLAETLGSVMTRVILAILFFGIVTPIGLVLRLSGRNLMDRRDTGRASHWTDYPRERRDRRHYERMF